MLSINTSADFLVMTKDRLRLQSNTDIGGSIDFTDYFKLILLHDNRSRYAKETQHTSQGRIY